MTTVPSSPNSELASISLVPLRGVAFLSSIPSIPSAVIVMLPPLPLKAVAVISLSLRATMVSAVMSILPPLPSPPAEAEILLLFWSCS